MNNPNQVRHIFEILKNGVGSKYKDLEILKYASALQELFKEEFEDGY